MNHEMTLNRPAVAHRMPPPGDCGGVGVKRAREPVAADDGIRVLVDRLWPRGLSRDAVAVDLWLREAAPSTALRRWYGHDPSRWSPFARKYRAELAARVDVLQLLDGLCRRSRVTLIHDTSNVLHNNALVLHDVLTRRRLAAPTAGRS